MFLFAFGLVACATSGDADDDLGTLDHPQRAVIAPEQSLTVVHATLRDADGIHAGDSDVTLRSGQVVLHREPDPESGARIVVDELLIAYEDVVLPTAYFHHGQVLTGISVRLESPLRLDAQARGVADLRLDWSLRVANEHAYPLESQTLTGFHVEVLVRDNGGDVRVDLYALRPDVMWDWASVITLGDAFVHATAHVSID